VNGDWVRMDFGLGTFAGCDGQAFIGVVVDDRMISLAEATEKLGRREIAGAAVADLLHDDDRHFDEIARVAEEAVIGGLLETAEPLDTCRPLPPLGRMGKMLYAGANYSDHVRNMRRTFTPALDPAEAARPVASLRPYMFGKVSSPTGAYDDILLPPGLDRIDWEGELMVVIGAPGRHIRAEHARRHIAGYMTTNDVSCRDLTWRDDRPTLRSDFLAGKSFDSFAPMGPYVTPKRFVFDHSDLFIRTWVNGDLKQDGNTRDMTFGVEELIEYASRMMTLLPGDVIATGSPAGTGQERLEFLRPNDLVEVEVQGCGRMRNTAVAEVERIADGK